MLNAATSTGFFDLAFGLPLHILANHAVVVLVPLGALALMLVIFVPKLRMHYRYPAVGIAFLGAVAAVVASQSGEALAERVGSPGIHEEWGERLVPVAWALVIVGLAWAILVQFTTAAARVWALVTSIAVVGLAIASVVLVILAGHSGAEVTWQNRVATTSETATRSPIPTPSVTASEIAPAPIETQTAESAPAPIETQAAAAVLSVEMVAANNTPASCWTIVSGQVYNLTEWIARHPGGSRQIEGMCGRDATADFERQHSGEGRPASSLAAYLIGSLGQPVQ